MRAVLDACVLFPSVVREILMGVAQAGLFTPLWSDKILTEWTYSVAARLGPEAGLEAQSARAFLAAQWPGALVAPAEDLEARLWLPDPADRHVLAAAIAGEADLIVTFNLRDFPVNLLAEQQLCVSHPDGFLLGLAHANPEPLLSIINAVLDQANRMQDTVLTRHKLLKKARLPRLAKFCCS